MSMDNRILTCDSQDLFFFPPSLALQQLLNFGHLSLTTPASIVNQTGFHRDIHMTHTHLEEGGISAVTLD